MSKYTTGEMAKLCKVTVRTVQYYDSRNILVPSELSEGGRRLYSEEDLRRLKIICYLRELGLSIDTIGRLLKEENPEGTISLLLEEKRQELKLEVGERQKQIRQIDGLQGELKKISHFTLDSIGDIAYIMENKKKLWHIRKKMLLVGLLMDAIEAGTLMLWILKGIWQPFALGMLVVVALGVWISWYYMKNTEYICPNCHDIFVPGLRENLWARHTPHARKLHCPNCSFHGFCVETYRRKEKVCLE